MTRSLKDGVADDDLNQQKILIKKLMQKPLKLGDTWYLIDPGWLRHFKHYVGYDEDGTDAPAASSGACEHPPPIDNSALLQESGELREQMIDGADYELVPAEVWQRLVQWYGVADNEQLSLARKVVEHGTYLKQTKVEVYLTELVLCLHSNLDETCVGRFSKDDTVACVEREMRRVFSVPAARPARLWNRYTTNTYELMASAAATIASVGLYQRQVVVMEVRNEDGTWPRTDCNSSSAPMSTDTSTPSMMTRYGSASLAACSSLSTLTATSNGAQATSNGGRAAPPAHRPGLCGLANLGNTCFMNSVLQCLSNTPPLCAYFRANRHLADLNAENPLGMRGEIAKSFASLIQEMWSGRLQSTVPRAFKQQVSRFAPQFSGYQQHDSQEMLTFILDALNEDLNRVRHKPYVELKDADGRPDSVVAREAWHNYTKRNDSVITDLFFGLLKSTVVCPECPKVSVTFDPFCMLQLPLPIKRERTLEVCLVFHDTTRAPTLYRLSVPKHGQVADVLTALEKVAHVSRDRLVLTDVCHNNTFRAIYVGYYQLHALNDKDQLVAYERPPLDAGHCYVPVYTRCSAGGPLDVTPFFVALHRGHSTGDQLAAAILARMARYCRSVASDQASSTAAPHRHRHTANTRANSAGELDSDDDEDEASTAATDAVNNNFDNNDKSNNNNNNNDDDDDDCDDNSTCGVPFRLSVTNLKGGAMHTTTTASATATAAATAAASAASECASADLPLAVPSGCALLATWSPAAFRRRVDLSVERQRHHHHSMHAKPSRARQAVALHECLELFTTVEKLGADDAWYCPDCKKHQQATKKFDLWSLPHILIVHLKRFSYSRILRDKIDATVEFPMRQLDMRPHVLNVEHGDHLVYDLIGVSNHYGGLGGGHYVAMCSNQDNGQWYSFDDSAVSPVSEDSVCTRAAYVLFYQRRSSDDVTPSPSSATHCSAVANGDSDTAMDCDS